MFPPKTVSRSIEWWESLLRGQPNRLDNLSDKI